ncbi:MAG: DUF4982 domain-containing protein [Chloroflexi bacterium]|nr:DUF4982 domain-containing protein [Chloroflexota bacterium]
MHRPARFTLNDNWRFRFGDVDRIPGLEAVSGWEGVTLPHTWNAFDTMHPDPAQHYRRGAGWYVRELDLAPLFAPERRYWVEIEAASQKAHAYLNNREIGSHMGGYTAFTLDVTPQREGAPERPHTLALRVDNTPDPDLIPSDMSDFFLYGGLTRNVWLYSTGPARLDTLLFDIDTTAERADLRLRGRLAGDISAPLDVRVTLFGPDGAPISDTTTTITETAFALELPAVQQPELWAPQSPTLYHAVITLSCAGEEWDRVEEKLGFRFFDFPAGGPFYLNGERLLLTGTHRHEDWAGYAAAVPDDLTRQEMQQIRDAGLNFTRLGHYPQAPAVLDACDALGLIVWEELPWCRGGVGRDVFRDQARTMLVEMIEQHYNRPSIIFWGLGNELDWDSEHPDSTDAKVVAFLRELHELSHDLDPRRLTALRRFEAGADAVDVYSPSIWSGWYRGRYEDYAQALQDAIQRYPRLLHMEWGGDSHVGRHNSGPHLPAPIEQSADHAEVPGLALGHDGPTRASRDSDWSESYMLDVMEWHLQTQRALPTLAGTAQWAFKDFGTPLRPENPIPYVNQKGLVDRAGRPKDVYFLFRAYLTGDPVCHIESPSWPVRVGAPDEPQRVRVYSNAAQVELYVNGATQGTQTRNPAAHPAGGLVWHVVLQPGGNLLRAVGTMPDGTIIEHSILQSVIPGKPGDPDHFTPTVTATQTPDGIPAQRVTVQLVDAQGILCVDDRRRVTFALTGNGQLWSERGTVDGCRVVELANGRASALVTVLAGPAELVAHCEDIQPLMVALAPFESETGERTGQAKHAT